MPVTCGPLYLNSVKWEDGDGDSGGRRRRREGGHGEWWRNERTEGIEGKFCSTEARQPLSNYHPQRGGRSENRKFRRGEILRSGTGKTGRRLGCKEGRRAIWRRPNKTYFRGFWPDKAEVWRLFFSLSFNPLQQQRQRKCGIYAAASVLFAQRCSCTPNGDCM